MFAAPSIAYEPLLPSQQAYASQSGNCPAHSAVRAASVICQRALSWVTSTFYGQATKQGLADTMMDRGQALGPVSGFEQEAKAGALLTVERGAVSWPEHAGSVPRPGVRHGALSLALAKADRHSGTRPPCPTFGVANRFQSGQDGVLQAPIRPLRGCSGPLRRALACSGSGLQRLLDRLFILYHRAALLQAAMR